MNETRIPELSIHPATAERWPDLELLFGKSGACGGCWCMFWRLERAEYKKMKGPGTHAYLRALTLDNRVPGLLAYSGGMPAGWCALGPREDFAALENSRILKRVDARPVWSIACFFIAKAHRKMGLTRALILAALEYAAANGASTVESYPIDLDLPQFQGQNLTGAGGFMGSVATFAGCGFKVVSEVSNTQRIMRCELPAPTD